MNKSLKQSLVIFLGVAISCTPLFAGIKKVQTLKKFNKEVLQSSKPAVVKFHAPWCPACKKMAKPFKNLAKKYKSEYTFAEVDIDKAKDITSVYQVSGIPTFLFFKGGDQLDGQIIGVVGQKKFEKKMKRIFK